MQLQQGLLLGDQLSTNVPPRSVGKGCSLPKRDTRQGPRFRLDVEVGPAKPDVEAITRDRPWHTILSIAHLSRSCSAVVKPQAGEPRFDKVSKSRRIAFSAMSRLLSLSHRTAVRSNRDIHVAELCKEMRVIGWSTSRESLLQERLPY